MRMRIVVCFLLSLAAVLEYGGAHAGAMRSSASVSRDAASKPEGGSGCKADTAGGPSFFLASQTGRQALDNGEGGGNPFASSIVELFGRESLIFDDFCSDLIDLTRRKSRGFQRPDVFTHTNLTGWRILPKPLAEKRVALVIVFSDYSVSNDRDAHLWSSLPGAKRDMQRVANAFTQAGFEVQTVIDPGRKELEVILGKFARHSADSDAALIYATGHGVDVDGAVYLLPGDYPFSQGKAALPHRAVGLTDLAASLRATSINLLFYGGCRNDPFGSE